MKGALTLFGDDDPDPEAEEYRKKIKKIIDKQIEKIEEEEEDDYDDGGFAIW